MFFEISRAPAGGVEEGKQGMQSSTVATAVKAVRHPERVRAALSHPGQIASWSRHALARKVFVGASDEYRSESDTGAYVALVQAAVKDYKAFTTFRRHPNYVVVLEHVTRQEGQAYLDILRKDAPDLIDRIEEFKSNDVVGSPRVFDYPGIGKISPTTLRYVKVASDLRKLFGAEPGHNVAEVGVGYGGQMLVCDTAFHMRQYDLFDLAPVLNLVERYLESHLLNSAYHTSTLNQCLGEESYDLVISNYAFSELPSALQRRYIEKVLATAKRGYLTMNSGTPETYFQHNKLSLAQLRELLPGFEVLPERPLTCPGNYIIAWGHSETL